MSKPEKLRDLSNQIMSSYLNREAIAEGLRVIADYLEEQEQAQEQEQPQATAVKKTKQTAEQAEG